MIALGFLLHCASLDVGTVRVDAPPSCVREDVLVRQLEEALSRHQGNRDVDVRIRHRGNLWKATVEVSGLGERALSVASADCHDLDAAILVVLELALSETEASVAELEPRSVRDITSVPAPDAIAPSPDVKANAEAAPSSSSLAADRDARPRPRPSELMAMNAASADELAAAKLETTTPDPTRLRFYLDAGATTTWGWTSGVRGAAGIRMSPWGSPTSGIDGELGAAAGVYAVFDETWSGGVIPEIDAFACPRMELMPVVEVAGCLGLRLPWLFLFTPSVELRARAWLSDSVAVLVAVGASAFSSFEGPGAMPIAPSARLTLTWMA